MLKTLPAACLLLFCYGAQADPERASNGWFRDFGVGFHAAAVFQETALGRDYDRTGALGPSLLMEVWRLPLHRFSLSTGYWYYFDKQTSGTKQVSVTTSHQRLDIAVHYDFCWKLLVAGAKTGMGMSIATTTTRLKETFNDLAGNNYFYDGTKKTATGVNPGFLFGITAGVNLGRLFRKKTPLDLRLLAQLEYIRHSERDDLSIGFAVVFWPMSVIRQAGQ